MFDKLKMFGLRVAGAGAAAAAFLVGHGANAQVSLDYADTASAVETEVDGFIAAYWPLVLTFVKYSLSVAGVLLVLFLIYRLIRKIRGV